MSVKKIIKKYMLEIISTKITVLKVHKNGVKESEKDGIMLKRIIHQTFRVY